MLLSALFPQFNVGFFMWVLNIALVVLGFFTLGISCMGWTVYSSMALSFYVSLCEAIWPMTAPFTNDTLLELIFAVLLPAIGSAIVFNIGASTGGTDIVALILTKHSSLNIGTALMASDILIVSGAALIFGVQTGPVLYPGPDRQVLRGGRRHREHQPAQGVHGGHLQPRGRHRLHPGRAAPLGHGGGGPGRLHRQEHDPVIMTVLTRREATHLRNFLRMNDNHAFITIVNSSEIIGKGFRAV